MTIKPEDISDELLDVIDSEFYFDCGFDRQKLADFLNAAIEAGVVSPPCMVLKTHDGYAQEHGAKQIRVWAGKPQVASELFEHYKGQK